MPDPVIVPRADHPISRKQIDPDALRVLYRLQSNQHTAYLVGGSVRDLILGRQPKDFDIGTSAHPHQIKRLFRNCWIIGRRFRLAHIKFGNKTIEVATFRRIVPETEAEAAAEESTLVASSPDPGNADAAIDSEVDAAEPARAPFASHHTGSHHAGPHAVHHRDNTFGTPEEDAFRRDFTINGLFYDIATFSVIDFVGGLQDLERRVIRSIGDPRVRFVEDPVRMLRAVVFGARLGFDLDPLVIEAIAEHRTLILKASPARLMEEYYKILRSGYAEASFRALGRFRLLELITPELKSPSEPVWDSLARLDRYRQPFPTPPPAFTNTILIGSLLVPMGALNRRVAHATTSAGTRHEDRVSFGMLQVAKRDIEGLRQVGQIIPRLTDLDLPPRVAKGLVHRPAFDDALAWLEVFGDAPDVVTHWRHARHHRPAHPPEGPPDPDAAAPEGEAPLPQRRRRRRRRRRGRGPSGNV